MSGIARQMFSLSTALNTISGALFGSGSLSIPVGATLVTMTGQGGTGGDNSYYNPGQPYIAATAGQPYIAPSSGGGPYSGANTTATLNGVTRTWLGGYATSGTPSTQTLTSTGAGQTLTYSVGSGGHINYSYTY